MDIDEKDKKIDWEGAIGWELLRLQVKRQTRQQTLKNIMEVIEEIKKGEE